VFCIASAVAPSLSTIACDFLAASASSTVVASAGGACLHVLDVHSVTSSEKENSHSSMTSKSPVSGSRAAPAAGAGDVASRSSRTTSPIGRHDLGGPLHQHLVAGVDDGAVVEFHMRVQALEALWLTSTVQGAVSRQAC
jgi:hypothetical protein